MKYVFTDPNQNVTGLSSHGLDLSYARVKEGCDGEGSGHGDALTGMLICLQSLPSSRGVYERVWHVFSKQEWFC